MAFHNLREFLILLEQQNELKCVDREVSPQYELAAICRKLISQSGPAVRFNKVEGSTTSVISNLLATKKRIALALDLSITAKKPENGG